MRKRLFRRGLIFLFSLSVLIGASWLIGMARLTSGPIESSADYFGPRFGAETDRAIAQLQTRLKAVPDDFAAYSQLGLAYLQKARETGDPTWYQKAEGALRKTLAGQADDYIANAAMGALELARHQFASAGQWGERARQINPDRAYAFGVMADAQIELGQYADAVTTLQTMVNLRPDAASYSRISYLRELHGDLDGAIEMMQAAVDAGGANTENTAWFRTQLGHLYFNTGDLARAEIEYQRTLELAPDYVHALAGLGRVRFAQGKTDEAIARLARAAQIMPLPEFVITLGEMYEVTGDQARAQEQYRLVRAIQQLYASNGVDLDLEIALFNADHGIDRTKTLEQARGGYARRPSIYAADVLAWALYRVGQYEEAQKYSDEALRLGTRDALKLYHAGLIAQQRGDMAQATTYLKQALALNPHFSILYTPQAQAALDQLARH